jgi:hypothetical protein
MAKEEMYGALSGERQGKQNAGRNIYSSAIHFINSA